MLRNIFLLYVGVHSAFSLLASEQVKVAPFSDQNELPRRHTDSVESDVSESYVVEKYGLNDPLNWPKARAIANELRATSSEKYEEGKFKVNVEDYRGKVEILVNNSRHRKEGQRLLAESEQLLEEAMLIEAATTSINLSDVAESYVARKYKLRDPLHWLEAQTIADKLKASSEKMHKEGTVKVKIQDERSSITHRVKDNSIYRAQGQQLLAESERQSEEASNIEDAINRIRRSYTELSDAKVVTGMRRWTSRVGGRSITARVLAVNGDRLILHRDDGLILNVAKGVFSDADILFLEESIKGDGSK